MQRPCGRSVRPGGCQQPPSAPTPAESVLGDVFTKAGFPQVLKKPGSGWCVLSKQLRYSTLTLVFPFSEF